MLRQWRLTGSYLGDQTLETESTVLLALALTVWVVINPSTAVLQTRNTVATEEGDGLALAGGAANVRYNRCNVVRHLAGVPSHDRVVISRETGSLIVLLFAA